MKKFTLSLAGAIFTFAACKKNDTKPTSTATTTSCSININLLKDVSWNPPNNGFAILKFTSGGDYYENTKNVGKWSNISCDTLKITGNKNFSYKIYSITADTLALINPTFGKLLYHK